MYCKNANIQYMQESDISDVLNFNHPGPPDHGRERECHQLATDQIHWLRSHLGGSLCGQVWIWPLWQIHLASWTLPPERQPSECSLPCQHWEVCRLQCRKCRCWSHACAEVLARSRHTRHFTQKQCSMLLRGRMMSWHNGVEPKSNFTW